MTEVAPATLRVVIVGGGFAGAAVVRALEQTGARDRLKIDLVEREAEGAYDRLELSRVVRGELRSRELVRYRPSWFAERGVTYHTGAAVRIVDRLQRRVHADRLDLPYDKLILATGSTPYLPPLKGLLRVDGSLHPGVFALRTLGDADALLTALSSARRVAVLGGGAMGLEIVEALCQRGSKVNLVHIAERLMNSVLDDAAAAILRQRIEALGSEVHFKKRAVEVLGDTELRGVRFRDDSELGCDVLILATGLQPETWLACQCGLSVERGIVVEGRMRSIDDFDVHAIGECAQWRGQIHALPDQILEQAQVIAAHLTERHSSRRYEGYKRGALYQVLGLSVSTLGSPEGHPGDDVIQLSQPTRARYKKVLLRNGCIVGAILLGDVRQADVLTHLYASCARLSHDTRERLFDLALPPTARLAVSQPPPAPPPAVSDEAGA